MATPVDISTGDLTVSLIEKQTKILEEFCLNRQHLQNHEVQVRTPHISYISDSDFRF